MVRFTAPQAPGFLPSVGHSADAVPVTRSSQGPSICLREWSSIPWDPYGRVEDATKAPF
jgi:hypothetical protein